ncbi:MAG: 3'-5' exonuclease, partial [Psychrobacter sp.]|nr:3'-5' exonuclease [Psychrobacter sp.]
MNNRALVLDVEATGITDDAQATELGWCDVYFNDLGELQPSTKAFVQRCKPELPISFGSMAMTHIHDDELIDKPSHKKVISQVVNNDVTYVIGHNIDYDMKVIGNAGVNRQFKRICTLAIARACYPVDTDHKLLAMLYMLDYEFARQHGKNAHSAKYDVMFCVRILRIMCINNNIRNMEQLYQFSERCRIPAYMYFGKHKGKLIDDVDLSYKRYMLDKGLD